MTLSAHQPRTDETTFGIGGQTSHDADVSAAEGRFGAPLWPTGSADEVVEDSHRADIDAAYDHSSKHLVKDGTGLHF